MSRVIGTFTGHHGPTADDVTTVPQQLRCGFMATVVHSALLALPVQVACLANALLFTQGVCALEDRSRRGRPEQPDHHPVLVLRWSALVALLVHTRVPLSPRLVAPLALLGCVATVGTAAIDHWVPRRLGFVRVVCRVLGTMVVRRCAQPSESLATTCAVAGLQASMLGAVALLRGVCGPVAELEYVDWLSVWLGLATCTVLDADPPQ
jgi:hypothetical protein